MAGRDRCPLRQTFSALNAVHPSCDGKRAYRFGVRFEPAPSHQPPLEVVDGVVAADVVPSSGDTCPVWCVVGHDPGLGEDDWVHVGEPVAVAEGMPARLCMTIDPQSRATDGPYVLVGWSEYTLEEAAALGASLVAMARTGQEASIPERPAASGRLSRHR